MQCASGTPNAPNHLGICVLQVTIQAPPGTTSTSVYWMIVRGIENSAVMLGEFELPPTARLRVHRVNQSLDNLELVTLAAAPAGTSGALVGTKFDASVRAPPPRCLFDASVREGPWM